MGVTRSKKETKTQSTIPERIGIEKTTVSPRKNLINNATTTRGSIHPRAKETKKQKTHKNPRPRTTQSPRTVPNAETISRPKTNEPEHAPCDMARGRNDMAGARELEGASAMAVLVTIPPRKRQSEEASGWALGLFGLVTPRAATSAAPTWWLAATAVAIAT